MPYPFEWAMSPWEPVKRDPREDDPRFYRDGSKWVERTEWTADNAPTGCGEDLLRYLNETTPAQRHAILKEQMHRKGLVQWNSCWVTPERAKELEKNFQEGLKRSREIQAQLERARASRSRLWYWC